MAIKCATGVFQCPSGTGVTQVISGLDFQPKAYILWGNEGTTETVVVHSAGFIGLTDGTFERSIQTWDEDGATNTGRDVGVSTDYVLQVVDENETHVVEAAHSSFPSDGISLNFTTTVDGQYVHWMAFGGAGLANVAAGEAGANATSETGVGFTSDFLFAISAGLDANGTPSQHSVFGLGCADRRGGTTHQWWLGAYNSDDATDNKDSIIYTDGFTGQQYNGSLTWSSSLSTFTSDGFTWSGTNADVWYYLAFDSGDSMEAYDDTKPTGAAPAAHALPAATFTPAFYLIASGSNVDETATTPNGSAISIGATDASGNQHHSFRSAENNTNANAGMVQNDSEILQLGKGGGGVDDSTAVASSITDSTPDLTWDPNSSNADIIGIWYIDADTITTVESSFTANAVIAVSQSSSFTLDALRGESFPGSTTLDAMLMAQEWHPDADLDAGDWDTVPLWSKIDDDDGTEITDTAS